MPTLDRIGKDKVVNHHLDVPYRVLERKYSFLSVVSIAVISAYMFYMQYCNVPKISIVIPCYNSEKYIQEVFNNLKAQTFSDYEVIFVDDGSTDNTNKMISNYKSQDKRAKLITLKTNIGTGNARNIGLKKAKGNYVIFLDSDDIYYSNLLEESYNIAKKNNTDITIFKSNYFDENTQIYSSSDIGWLWNEPYPINEIFTPDDVKDNLFTFCRGVLWNKLYKRSFLKRYNFHFLNLKMHNDSYFVYCTYVMAKKIYITDKVLISYRINHKNSITTIHKKIYDEKCKMESVNALKSFLIENGLSDKYKIALQRYSDTF